MDLNRIKFGNERNAEIFSAIAEEAAREIKANSKCNKTTQLRKFYDELAMWNDRVQTKPENYQMLEPFIKMLKAKVAYAQARGYVDDKFSNIFNQTVNEIKNVETLRDAKLFMEAVMGYCKFEEEMNKPKKGF